jgi:hypothetical protein
MVLQLPPTWAVEEAASPSLPFTLIYRSESDAPLETTTEALQPFSSQVIPAQGSVFYPTRGQSPLGFCWEGLRIDSNDNVYPINDAGAIYKILPDGTLVNGVDDQNFFASFGLSDWFELDESGGNFYTASPDGNAYVAPFVEGGHFSAFISGLSYGRAITLGQGPLAGNLFATEIDLNTGAGQVSRITLSPVGLSVFASGPALLCAATIASASDGTLYVVSPCFSLSRPPQLTKITPAGVPSTFAIGINPTTPIANPVVAVIVDDDGNVYWSNENGINKYDASGNLLGTLPRPPGTFIVWNPFGTAFDTKGNLYVVDNSGCKKIYKYTIEFQADCTDLAMIEASFGKHQGQPGFDPGADINQDGVVDVKDLAFVAQHLPAGTHCP